MKALNVYVGSVAIKNWKSKTEDTNDFIEIGTLDDTNCITFKHNTTKEDIFQHRNDVINLMKNTEESLKEFYRENRKYFEEVLSIFEKYDKIRLCFASGGLFSSNVVLNLLNRITKKEIIEIITTSTPLDVPLQDFILEQLNNQLNENQLKIIILKSKKEELLSDYLMRLDTHVCQIIKKQTCFFCTYYSQTGMSVDMSGGEMGYCNLLRKDKKIKTYKAIVHHNHFCKNFKTRSK